MDELQFCISTLPSCQTCPKGIAQFFRKNSAHSVNTPFKFLDFSNWSPYQCQNVPTCGISTLMKESFNGTRVQWNIQNPTKWATFSQTIKFMVRPPKTSKCTEFREALTCKKIIGFRHMIYLINQRFWQIEQDSGHQAPEEYSYSTTCHELPYQTSYIVLVHRYSHFFASMPKLYPSKNVVVWEISHAPISLHIHHCERCDCIALYIINWKIWFPCICLYTKISCVDVLNTVSAQSKADCIEESFPHLWNCTMRTVRNKQTQKIHWWKNSHKTCVYEWIFSNSSLSLLFYYS